MLHNVSISIVLDKRRAKASGKYPVRLRVFTSQPKVQKLYPTSFDLSEAEFKSACKTKKPRKQHKDLRAKLQALEVRATEVAEQLDTFTFEAFEKKMYRAAGAGSNVFYQYNVAIERLRSATQIGTADVYDLSMKAVQAYLKDTTKQSNPDKLTFYQITPAWLNSFERYMIEDKGRSYTTVSIYVRALRTLFNTAIIENEIPKELYPFGDNNGKYKVPAATAVKKALKFEQLRTLYHAEPMTPEQEKARDFWFFSYACNGMNVKDIALLRYSNIKDGKISYLRAKTIRTKKERLKPVQVLITDKVQALLDKYGNKTSNPSSLVFSIIAEGMSPKEQQVRIKSFTRFINQHLKKLAAANGLPDDISTYWARHSFATIGMNKGKASMEYMSDALGHGSMKTTKGYFAGFEDETHREIQEKILDF